MGPGTFPGGAGLIAERPSLNQGASRGGGRPDLEALHFTDMDDPDALLAALRLRHRLWSRGLVCEAEIDRRGVTA